MAQVIVNVATGSDDGYETTDNTLFNASSTGLLTGTSTQYQTGVRFIIPSIANGDTISASVLKGYITSVTVDDPNLDIHCHDVDNSPTFDSSNRVTPRIDSAATTAFTTWTATSVGISLFTSPDFTAAVQEVIDRPGWSAGNGLTVLLKYRSSSTCYFASLEHPTKDELQITIDYTAGGGATIPVFDHHYRMLRS